MSNRLAALLSSWHPYKDECLWVLATIIETKRSSYRKTGAMMLINSLGKSYGLLSGGCLEADLMRQAQKCWHKGQSLTVCYDMQDDSDVTWQLGIGCGGLVKILLQPINQANNYLDLCLLKKQLDNRQHCFYHIDTLGTLTSNQVLTKSVAALEPLIEIKPAPGLIIFGGGIDAQPLVSLAKTLGWYICLVDSRTAYARSAYFKDADRVIKQDYSSLEQNLILPKADAVVIMHHNVTLDAQALQLVHKLPCFNATKYLGLLGPQHRTDKVFEQLTFTTEQLTAELANPIGLDLGGELPESIALAILAQAHAKVENASAAALGSYTETQQLLTRYGN